VDSRKQPILDLLSAVWQAFDDTYGSRRELAEEFADEAGMTLEEYAAGLVVRHGEMPLRKLLPDIPRDEVEECIRDELEEVFRGPDRERYEQEAALEGVALGDYGARHALLKVLGRFGATPD
jgi:hypothetical protein